MSFGERLRQERLRRHLSQEALAEALKISPKSISRWERGQAIPQAHYRLHLSRFFGLALEDLFENFDVQVSPSFIWTVPFPRNPCFTGREEVLQMLHTRLAGERPGAPTQISALSGLGGIGKTQVAIEYAYRYAHEYDAVLWLTAECTESLMMSLQQIANQLQLPERQTAEQPQMVAAVRRWLAAHSSWLLIGDNVENLDLLQTVLPPVRQGALLLTTRCQALGMLVEPLELPPMNWEEGAILVLRRAKRHPQLEAPVMEEAAELVKLLEGLPLALDQAGAYIEETGCSVAEYLRRYQDQRKNILARRGIHGEAHPASVTATLSLSVERVEREHVAAAALLRVCAFLHPEAIPEELLIAGASYVGAVLGSTLVDPYQFDLALAALRNVSLVARCSETRMLAIHRLVQAVLRDQMDAADVRLWGERVIRMVNAAFPDGRFRTWAQCERYLAHALACVSLVQVVGKYLPEAGELLHKAGFYLLKRGRFGEAEPLLEQAVALGEHLQDPNHMELIVRLESRAELFWKQGKYRDAELLLHRVLALEEKYLGLTHPQTAETLNNLAIQCYYQGKYERAESLYQQALAIRVQCLGPEYPETASTLNNLANLYRDQRKYEQAELLYQRALHIWEGQLGLEHPETLIPLNGLANLYRDQGKCELAESLYQRVLRIREEQLGSEHPETLITLNGLANLYRDQGKYELAESLYQRVLRIREEQLEYGHPEIALTLGGLANLYRDQGKYERAEPLYQRVLAICAWRLGSEHPRTVKIRNDYQCLLERGRRDVEGLRGEQQEPAQPLAERGDHKREMRRSPEAEREVLHQGVDPLKDFLAACCELHPRAWSRAGDLWQAYERWSGEKQERFPLSRRAFSAQLKARGCRAARTNSARIWRGITIIHKDM